MRFHDQLTVVAGIGELEREELLTSVVGALAGAVPGTCFVYLDELGQEVTVETNDDGTAEAVAIDGTPTTLVAAGLGTVDDVIRLVRVDGADLGVRPRDDQIDRHPELRDARQALDEISEELQSALAAEQTSEAMRHELSTLDERIRRAEESQARRAYAKVLAALERVRTEAAALNGGAHTGSADKLLLKRRDEINELARRWEHAARSAEKAAGVFGDREPLTEEELRQAVRFPDHAPEQLDALVRRHQEAEATRDRLADQLRDIAAASLPEPSEPIVATLARFPQDELWAANAAVRRTTRVAEAVRLGLDPDVEVDDLSQVVAELEAVHAVLEEARADAEDATVKLMVNKRVSEAEKREREILDRLGLPAYLGFHIRQLELTLDPAARARVEQADLEQRLAAIRWVEITGEIDADAVAHLEDEVRAYAAEIEELGETAAELDRLRRQLHEEAEPGAEAARRELLAACQPFGVDDTELALEMVTHQLELGRIARLQHELSAAAEAERSAADDLAELLLNVGFTDGDLSARLGAYRWAAERAEERSKARESARSIEEVRADLQRLEAEADGLRRPEWSNVTAADADEPELDELKMRRESTAAAYDSTRSLIPDLDRLRDRYKAVLRRVEVLETDLRERGMLADGATDGVEQYLLARLAAVRGAADNPVLPVVLDDPFRTLDPERKAELMELCQRLADRVQVIYLTDDADIARWARRHTNDGTLTLMEPAEEAATV